MHIFMYRCWCCTTSCFFAFLEPFGVCNTSWCWNSMVGSQGLPWLAVGSEMWGRLACSSGPNCETMCLSLNSLQQSCWIWVIQQFKPLHRWICCNLTKFDRSAVPCFSLKKLKAALDVRLANGQTRQPGVDSGVQLFCENCDLDCSNASSLKRL